MTGVPLQQMADRVAGLMEERLSVKGAGLAEKLQRGGRVLPRRVRAAAEVLRAGADMAQNPKLLLQVDQQAVSAAYDTCVRHLSALKPKRPTQSVVAAVAGAVGFSLLSVAVIVVAVLIWRGFI